MQINEIVAALNQEISRLEQVRDLLANSATGEQSGKRRGRPKGSVNKVVAALREVEADSPKRQMSEEGRARIAEAQRKRWAASKQTSKSGSSSSRQGSGSGTRSSKPSKASKKTSGRKVAAKRQGEPKNSAAESASAAA